MESRSRKKIIKSFLGITAALILFFSSKPGIPPLDTRADRYFGDAIKKAGVVYATCRVINASVSVIKDSSLELEPAGVGISLAVGQALDPIDDMTERLSDVMVTAIASLGIQKLAHEISLSLAPPLLGILLFALSLLIWLDRQGIDRVQGMIVRFALILLVVRFCLPLSSLANEFVHANFFEDKIEAAKRELALGSRDLDRLQDFSVPQGDGLLGTLDRSTSFIKRKSLEFKDALVSTVANMGTIVENLLKLTFLYAGIFLIQVIFFPLIVFWLLLKATNSLFETAFYLSRGPGFLKKENATQ